MSEINNKTIKDYLVGKATAKEMEQLAEWLAVSIKCLLPVEFVLVSPFMSLSVTKIYNVCVESKMTTNELKITL